MNQLTVSNVYLHTATPTNAQTDLLQLVVTANLAILTSTIWSYGWRIGHLRNAVDPGLQAIRQSLIEQRGERTDPRVNHYFSQKWGAQLQATVEAGTVVLVHSLLDGVLTKLLSSFVLLNTAHWESRILKAATKEYSLQQAITMDRASAFDKAADGFIHRFGKESLIKKNELLFAAFTDEARAIHHQLLQPGESLLRRFDRFRHQIVHEDGLVKIRYDNALLDAGVMLDHASALVFATAVTLGVPQDEIYKQMSTLGLEGVASPLTESDLESIEITPRRVSST
ncbi:hypothetical protein [Tunturibacter empetritectus]|uniref:RiboL-PSP-HEPN domain-containing protein n=1 Tax=Tunturiibacter lichenicola TaxID=2051959 RepID=A0A7W8JCA8_9BACT|nr:hypothetical protein [Edaphobacter lichenicola]MBB5345381.1 hypothetical protein [Edaphobacter lichenicola]